MARYEEPIRNLSMSSFSECSSYYIPSVQEYFQAPVSYRVAIICGGAVSVLLTIYCFVDTVRYVTHHAPSRVKAYTTFLTAVYPVVCLVSYIALLVPRSHILSEVVTQVSLMAAMYQLFSLFVAYCGGASQLALKTKGTRLNMKVGPCCCFPCCSYLPSLEISKKTVTYLKLQVLQLPLVQGLVYFVILVMWLEDQEVYEANYLYLQLILILSILCGIWGMLMTIKVLSETLHSEFLLTRKFLVLQMVLIMCSLQQTVVNVLVNNDVLPCDPPITPHTYGNLIENVLVMIEMVIIGGLARKLYKRELPETLPTRSMQNGISIVIGDSPRQNNASGGVDNAGYVL